MTKIDPNTIYAADISHAGMIRIYGADAPRFVRTMYSGSMESFDTLYGVSQGMILSSEGEVMDMVGVIRTGSDECLVITSTDNVAEILMWLEAHAELEDDNGPIFADVTIEDQSLKLALMLLYGERSDALVAELKEACEGKIYLIDARLAQTTYAVPQGPGHILLVAPNMAHHIGEFLNSCEEVEALTLDEYQEHLAATGMICEQLMDAGYHKPDELGLTSFLRDVHDFVGARALGLE